MFNNGSSTNSSPRERDRVRDKLKSICCFRTADHHDETGPESEELKPRSPQSPYKWLRSRMSRHGSGRKQTGSSDFSYDPMSYALNFEDETPRDAEMPFKSFSSRLQATPERIFDGNCKSEPSVTASRAIVLCG